MLSYLSLQAISESAAPSRARRIGRTFASGARQQQRHAAAVTELRPARITMHWRMPARRLVQVPAVASGSAGVRRGGFSTAAQSMTFSSGMTSPFRLPPRRRISRPVRVDSRDPEENPSEHPEPTDARTYLTGTLNIRSRAPWTVQATRRAPPPSPASWRPRRAWQRCARHGRRWPRIARLPSAAHDVVCVAGLWSRSGCPDADHVADAVGDPAGVGQVQPRPGHLPERLPHDGLQHGDPSRHVDQAGRCRGRFVVSARMRTCSNNDTFRQPSPPGGSAGSGQDEHRPHEP